MFAGNEKRIVPLMMNNPEVKKAFVLANTPHQYRNTGDDIFCLVCIVPRAGYIV